MVLIIGTPNKVPLILGNYHISFGPRSPQLVRILAYLAPRAWYLGFEQAWKRPWLMVLDRGGILSNEEPHRKNEHEVDTEIVLVFAEVAGTAR